MSIAPKPAPTNPAEHLRQDPAGFYDGLPDSAKPVNLRFGNQETDGDASEAVDASPEVTEDIQSVPDEVVEDSVDTTPAPPDFAASASTIKDVRTLMTGNKEPTKEQKVVLAALGIDDAFLADIKEAYAARNASTVQRVATKAGGEALYAKMVEWASTAMSASQQKMFNDAVSSRDESQIDFAVAGLKAQYQAKNGVTGKRIDGKATEGSGHAFKDMKDVTTAMSDKRYGKDKEYTDSVAHRVSLTPRHII